ncbi:MAG TPA: hypothetical protein VF808_13730 [Ktedonobacterales bacterium]
MDQQPPQYGQQQYQPAPSSPGAQWGPTSIGLESHIAAGLGYLIPIIGLIFFFIEKTNRFVRFHGAQAILLVVAYVVVGFVDIFLGIVLGIITQGNGLGFLSFGLSCVFFLLFAAIFAFQIWGIVAGFTGKYTKFPIVGDIAERMAGGPLA